MYAYAFCMMLVGAGNHGRAANQSGPTPEIKQSDEVVSLAEQVKSALERASAAPNAAAKDLIYTDELATLKAKWDGKAIQVSLPVRDILPQSNEEKYSVRIGQRERNSRSNPELYKGSGAHIISLSKYKLTLTKEEVLKGGAELVIKGKLTLKGYKDIITRDKSGPVLFFETYKGKDGRLGVFIEDETFELR